MLKRTIISLLLLFLLVSGASAQKSPEERRERIEAARISYLTDKLKLTPEQAQKFWPVYNELTSKRRELKAKSRVFKDEDLDALSDAQLREGINQMMDYRQREIELDKAYVDRFLSVITPRQLATLYRSEKEFMRLLIKRMDEKPDRKKGATN